MSMSSGMIDEMAVNATTAKGKVSTPFMECKPLFPTNNGAVASHNNMHQLNNITDYQIIEGNFPHSTLDG